MSLPETKTKDVVIKSASEIVDSAGKLANYTDPYELIAELIKDRKKSSDENVDFGEGFS